MKSFTQLFRRPWKWLLGVLFSLLACLSLCVSAAQYIASAQARAGVEDTYCTVGVLTGNYMHEYGTTSDGTTFGIHYPEQPAAVQEFLQELPQALSCVRGVQQSLRTSAYLPQLTPLNYYGADVAYSSDDTAEAETRVKPYPYTYPVGGNWRAGCVL